MNMNILVVCHYGLYENLSFSFVHNQIREFAAKGHRVRVVIPIGVGKTGRGGERFGRTLTATKIDGVELYDLRYVTLSGYGEKGFNTSSAIAAIRLHWNNIFKDFRPDVIHAHTLGFDSEIGVWLKGKFQCPLVATTHGGDTDRLLARGEHVRLKVYCDGADLVTAVSDQLRKRLAACGTETPLRGIVNGFIPRPIPEGTVKNLHSLIQVGHLIPSKRVDTTIRAFAMLRREYPNLKLTIVGKGPLRQQLEDLCTELGVADSVEFTGEIPNDRVFARLCEAGFFVMASKPEGFGIVYLEAMAAGCVTIGTEGEGVADVIVSGENGFLVPADEPEKIAELIDRCIRTPETAAQIGEKAAKTAGEMTWEHNAKQYLTMFEALKKEV